MACLKSYLGCANKKALRSTVGSIGEAPVLYVTNAGKDASSLITDFHSIPVTQEFNRDKS